MSKGKRIGLAILLGATIALPASAATPPSISNLPVVSASTLIADDTTQYTVTMTARDVDGYNNLRCMRVLFNYTESGGDPSQGRGQMVWGRTDADVTQYGGTWVIADATGGGRWG
mgnify:FL=1